MSFKEHTTLGRTGLRVSRLGIAAGYGVPAAAVEKAFHEHGVNTFYWGSRKGRMGDALGRLARSDRDGIVIILQSYDRIGWFLGRTVERELRALATDLADVLILGWHNGPPRRGVIDAALKLRERGLVRHIALSGHDRAYHGRLAASPDSVIDILMVRYNAAHRGAEQDVFPHLPEQNRPGVMIYTATRWGQLLKQKRMPAGERPLSASECYRFVLSHPAVDLCMIGPRTEKEMDEGLVTLERGPLNEEELARVRRIGDHVHGRGWF